MDGNRISQTDMTGAIIGEVGDFAMEQMDRRLVRIIETKEV
jgi:hypothetical protein